LAIGITASLSILFKALGVFLLPVAIQYFDRHGEPQNKQQAVYRPSRLW
jgi:hypothetical protein